MKAGAALVKSLEKVDALLSGIPGSEFSAVLDTAQSSDKLDFILTHSEANAGGFAFGVGQTGKVGAAMVTKAPGGLAGLVPVHSAEEHSVPMLYIITAADYEIVNEPYAWQNRDFGAVTKPIVKDVIYVAPYKDEYTEKDAAIHKEYTGSDKPPMNIADSVAEAVRISQSGYKGPVTIVIPKDVLLEEVPDNIKLPDEQSIKPIEYKQDPKHRDTLYEKLNSAQKPVIIVSNAASHLLDDEVTELAKKSGAVVFGTFLNQDQKLDNPNYAGYLGLVRRPGIDDAVLTESDMILFVGTKGNEMELFQFKGGMHLTEKDGVEDYGIVGKIFVVTPEYFPGHKRMDYELNVFGDMKEIITDLSQREYNLSPSKQGWVEKNHQEYAGHIEKQVDFEGNLSVQMAMRDLSKNLPENTIVVAATMAGFTYLEDIKYDRDKGQMVYGGSEAMGYHAGRAMGLAKAQGKDVVFLVGDGGALMNNQIGEISSFIEAGVNATFVVFDNQAHGAILTNLSKQYADGVLKNKPGNAVLHNNPTDFAAIGEAYGAENVHVLDDNKDTAKVFGEAFKHPKKVDGKGSVNVVQMKYSPLNSVRGHTTNSAYLDESRMAKNQLNQGLE